MTAIERIDLDRKAYQIAAARALANDDWELCEVLDRRLERLRRERGTMGFIPDRLYVLEADA